MLRRLPNQSWTPVAGGKVAVMGLSGDQVISAQVVLADGCESAAGIQENIAKLGLKVGPCVGISFSVTGRLALFQEIFRHRVRAHAEGSLEFVDARGGGTRELAGKALPDSLAGSVQAVTFTAPPDFGPTNW